MPCEAPVTIAVLLPAMLNPCFYLQEWGMPQINLASNVIAALSTLETGQFFSASLAIRANAAQVRHLGAQRQNRPTDAKSLTLWLKSNCGVSIEFCGRVACCL